MSNFEVQYLETMGEILDFGIDRPDRTGIGSRALPLGKTLSFNLADGFPITTTRKTTARIAFEETWFFLRGETDTKKLEAKKINIWKGNTTREFLDKRGLHYLPEGNMGKGYGFQWRNFGGGYALGEESKEFPGLMLADYSKYDGEGFDQVAATLEGLKKDPNGRRHIISGWHPGQLHEMALPPCHLYQQYQVLDGYLNSGFVMRSWDFLYGAPFNIMGYALLNEVFAKYLGLKPGRLAAVGMDVHLYDNQLAIAEQQYSRMSSMFKLPTLHINKSLNTFQDVLDLEWTDFRLDGYEAHPDFKDKPSMAI